MERDLTVGSVPGQLIRFAFPLFLSNLLQSCYSVVDMAVVGRFVGGAGLAAVSSASILCFLITSLGWGITIGGGVLVAQYKGARDEEGQRNAAGALLLVSAAAALLLTAIGLLVYEPVLLAMGLPPEAAPHAYGYMRVSLFGTVFVFGYNAVCSIMRGLGDSRGPLAYVAIASVANVALDLILVGPLGMGTRGAALATVAAQGLSFAIAFARLRRGRGPTGPEGGGSGGFRLGGFRLRADMCATILRIGIPSALQSAALNLSYLLVTAMLNAYGVTIAAAAGIGLKVNGFAVMPCWAIGQAVTTMAGQNMGSGDPRRAAGAAKAGAILGMAVTAATVILAQAFAGPVVGLFAEDASIVAGGILYLRICCSVNCLAYAAMYAIDSFATGVGDSAFAMCNALLHSVAVRLLLSYILGVALGRGYVGIYWAEMLCPLPSLAAGIVYYRLGRWRRRRLIG
jgi:putative MATE family efflux protein